MERGGEESVEQLPFFERHRGKLWFFGIIGAYCAVFGLPSLKFLFWIGVFVAYNIGNVITRQNQIIYPAQPGPNARNQPLLRSPNEWQLPYESVMLQSGGGSGAEGKEGAEAVPAVRIHAWFIHHGQETRRFPTVVYFHGNAGNLGNRCPLYHQLYYHCAVNILAVEYRGYGESAGEPSEEGLKADARAALAYLATREDVDQSSIFLFGASLGGAVATQLAAEVADEEKRGEGEGERRKYPPVRGVILENTFTGVAELALELLWMVRILVCLTPALLDRLFVKNHWRSIDAIGRVRCPLLFLSGLKDEIVPARQMRALADAARARPGLHPANKYTRFVAFPQGTHNDTCFKGGRRFLRAVREFVRDQLPPGSPGRASIEALEKELAEEEVAASVAAAAAAVPAGDEKEKAQQPQPMHARAAGDVVLRCVLLGQAPPVAALRTLLGAKVYDDLTAEEPPAAEGEAEEGKEKEKQQKEKEEADSGAGVGLPPVSQQQTSAAMPMRRRSSSAAAPVVMD